MAEALLRDRLAVRGIDGHTSSAGLLLDGRAAEDGALRAMARRGLDIGAHRSRVISEEMAAAPTLILTMERDHVRRISALGPDVFARSFTLPEFVNSAQVIGPLSPGQDPAAWIATIGSSRRLEAYYSDGQHDDIADPMGRSRRIFRRCADEIDAKLAAFVHLAWPEPPPTDDHVGAHPPSNGSL